MAMSIDFKAACVDLNDWAQRVNAGLDAWGAELSRQVGIIGEYIRDTVVVPIVKALTSPPMQDMLRHQRMIQRAVRKLPTRHHTVVVVPMHVRRRSGKRAKIFIKKGNVYGTA